jgi:hypothetical protein
LLLLDLLALSQFDLHFILFITFNQPETTVNRFEAQDQGRIRLSVRERGAGNMHEICTWITENYALCSADRCIPPETDAALALLRRATKDPSLPIYPETRDQVSNQFWKILRVA